MANELATRSQEELSSTIEQVLIQGDLAKLSPMDRVEYYKKVCEGLGLNYMTRPFDYINLNGKLTLYARKDATDQLRRLYGVSIDDLKREFVDDMIIVTAKGHDASGRTDVEVGVVSRKDMGGKLENAIMKANTKAKRRLTLSLVGLGWLDETEVESIPKSQAQTVTVDDNGVIVEEVQEAPKAVVVEKPTNNTPAPEKPVETQEKPKFDEVEFLRGWRHRADLPAMTLEAACQVKDGNGKEYGTHTVERLFWMMNAIQKKLPTLTSQEAKDTYMMKLSAINEIFSAKASAQAQLDKRPDPFVKKEQTNE